MTCIMLLEHTHCRLLSANMLGLILLCDSVSFHHETSLPENETNWELFARKKQQQQQPMV